MASDAVISHRRQKEPDVVSRVHVASTLDAAVLGPLLGYESPAHSPFAANSDTRQQAQNCQLPDIHGESAEKSEHRIAQDGDHECADAAKFVAYRPPQKRQPPPDQKQREEQAAVVPDVRLRGGNAGAWQQFPQRGHQDEGIDKGVHPVKRPPSPRCPEAANLVPRKRGKWDRRTGRRRRANWVSGRGRHRRGNYTRKMAPWINPSLEVNHRVASRAEMPWPGFLDPSGLIRGIARMTGLALQ